MPAKPRLPAPVEIELSCSCPDWASMCKHVAAVLYGIGARLDDQPELLFRLRKVDEKDLIAKAGSGIPLSKKGPAADKVLGAERLSELFGLEMATGEGDSASGSSPAPAKPAGERRAKPRPAVEEIPPVREARASRSARDAGSARKRARKTEEKPGRPPKKAEAARPAKKKRNIP